MTEEIIKECKNCDALGIDSEIGVYYCCLSHRQDDLPKEFTCIDFTPNKQLKRLEQDSKQLTQWLDEARRNADFWCDKCTSLEQENKELKKQIESDKGLITVGGKQQYQYLQKIDELEQQYNTICYNLHLAEKERDELKEALAKKIIIPDYVKMNEQIDELKQENKALKDNNNHLQAIIDDGRAENKRFREENKELKEENIKIKKEFNNLIAEIISDIEYTGEIACNGESPQEHLKKCQKALKALEEIREIAKDIIENDVYENSDVKAEKIIRKIDEVLKIDIQKS